MNPMDEWDGWSPISGEYPVLECEGGDAPMVLDAAGNSVGYMALGFGFSEPKRVHPWPTATVAM